MIEDGCAVRAIRVVYILLGSTDRRQTRKRRKYLVLPTSSNARNGANLP